MADRVARGDVCLLSACRTILSLRHRLGAVPLRILDPIGAVESELDDTPNESAAALWNPGALQAKLQEKEEYLERGHPILLRCFKELREHLATN